MHSLLDLGAGVGMKVRVGPWAFELDAPGLGVEIDDSLDSFIAESWVDPDFRLVFEESDGPLAANHIPRLFHDGVSTRLEMELMRATWSQGDTEIITRVWRSRGHKLALALRNPLVNALHILGSELLRSLGGLFFHAAALKLQNGLSVLVPGTPGSGKTTFSSGEWVEKRFTDEHALVDSSGEVPLLWGVPFSGRQKLPPDPGYSPLDLIVFIEQGRPEECPSLRELSRNEALQGLLRSLICYDGRPQVLARNVEAMRMLAEQVPSYTLRYHMSCGTEATSILYERVSAA